MTLELNSRDRVKRLLKDDLHARRRGDSDHCGRRAIFRSAAVKVCVNCVGGGASEECAAAGVDDFRKSQSHHLSSS